MAKLDLFLLEVEEERDEVSELLVVAEDALSAAGVELPSPGTRPCGWVVLVIEAVNHAAKVIDEDFYVLKTALVNAVAADPAFAGICGWCGETFGIWHPEIGTIHVHDPYDQIKSDRTMDYPWSRVRRQHLAFRAMRNSRVRRALAIATRPGRVWSEDRAEKLDHHLGSRPARLPK